MSYTVRQLYSKTLSQKIRKVNFVLQFHKCSTYIILYVPFMNVNTKQNFTVKCDTMHRSLLYFRDLETLAFSGQQGTSLDEVWQEQRCLLFWHIFYQISLTNLVSLRQNTKLHTQIPLCYLTEQIEMPPLRHESGNTLLFLVCARLRRRSQRNYL